ncbi:MAG: sigma-70 family RNA polymerase sigma factor [Acidimicrobiia bacterium]|nr:sigma-70 family RNA polymerase sigma factor [Acidimicrobiia bacterium]
MTEKGEHQVTPDGLVEGHLDLVGHVVSEVSSRYPQHVDRGELWNAGALGLVEAAKRFDPTQGIPFARYASIRIRGAIVDSTRARDWAPRSVRRDLREVRSVSDEFEARKGRDPSQAELAGALGITAEELRRRQSKAANSTVLQLDATTHEQEPLRDRVASDQRDFQPAGSLIDRELMGTLRVAVAYLPELQAEVVRRYYLEGDLLQDIARDHGVTEARVSQIRGEALSALRSFFATQYDGVSPVDEDSPGKRSRAAYLARVRAASSVWSRVDAGSPPIG